MNVNVTTNMRAVIAEVKGEYPREIRKAASRALNRSAVTVRKEASDEIRKVYTLKAGKIKSQLRIRKSSPASLIATVSASGKPIALTNFRPRKTRRGVSVEVKHGQRKLIKSAFMIEGRPGIWLRVEDLKSRKPRNKRIRPATQNDLPIAFLTSVSIPTAFTNDVVLRALTRVAFTSFDKNFRSELAFRLGSR